LRELRALPFAEIVFSDPKVWPVYTYDAKWATSSREHETSPLHVGVRVPPEWNGRILDAARGSFRLLGCRDYARVDLRVTAQGEPFILEVNANPFIYGLELTEGLPAIGKSHREFICDLVRAALARGNAIARAQMREPHKPRSTAS
jgi:D-alanine-D-alanine ligase